MLRHNLQRVHKCADLVARLVFQFEIHFTRGQIVRHANCLVQRIRNLAQNNPSNKKGKKRTERSDNQYNDLFEPKHPQPRIQLILEMLRCRLGEIKIGVNVSRADSMVLFGTLHRADIHAIEHFLSRTAKFLGGGICLGKIFGIILFLFRIILADSGLAAFNFVRAIRNNAETEIQIIEHLHIAHLLHQD